MSKKKCYTVGYAYFLNFIYVFAEHTTRLSGVYMDGEVVYGRNVVEKVTRKLWNGKTVTTEIIENNPPLTGDGTITFRTGKQNDTVPSDSPDGTVHYVTGGDYQLPKIREWAHTPIKYKNVSALVFDDCFIGDGVRTIPQYSILASNGQYMKVSGNTNDSRANPIDIIYDILKRDLKMPDSMINVDSFATAAGTIESEGIYVGMVMTSEKKVTYWFDRLLQVVDGALYYDPLTNLLTIKLFRDDYDVDDLIELTDSMISDLVVDAPSWQDTYNKITFKYTDPFKDDVASVEYINTASRVTLGYDRPKTIDLAILNSPNVVGKVANRMMAKLGIPYSTVKFKIDAIDFPNIHIGAVFKLNSEKMGISGKVYRVMKLTGDSEDKAYINVTAIEDFYAKNFDFEIIDDGGDDYVPPVYDINTPPTYFKAIDGSREFVEDGVDAMFWMAGKPEDTDYITAINVECINGGSATGQPALIGRTLEIIPEDIRSETETCKEYSQTYTFVIEDVDGSLYEILGSSASLQSLRHTMVIGNEIIAFKSLLDLTGGRYQVVGVMRGVGGTEIVEHPENELVYINGVLESYTSYVRVPHSDPILKAYAYNHQTTGPKVTIYPEYNRTTMKPYKPVPYIQDGKIVWRPRVAKKGAAYQNPDNISAGEDEGTVTGYYVVLQPDGTKVTITPQTGDILIEFTPTQTGLHKIKHVDSSSHLYDGWAEIVV
jgi:hypothetical protein